MFACVFFSSSGQLFSSGIPAHLAAQRGYLPCSNDEGEERMRRKRRKQARLKRQRDKKVMDLSSQNEMNRFSVRHLDEL